LGKNTQNIINKLNSKKAQKAGWKINKLLKIIKRFSECLQIYQDRIKVNRDVSQEITKLSLIYLKVIV
jgi:hypothetical protein